MLCEACGQFLFTHHVHLDIDGVCTSFTVGPQRNLDSICAELASWRRTYHTNVDFRLRKEVPGNCGLESWALESFNSIGLIKSLINGMFDIISLLLFVTSLVHCQLCYTPSGGILHGYGPCKPSFGVSLCCAVGDHCLSNSLCETPNSIYYRGGCTSKAYLNGECPAFCGTGILYLDHLDSALIR